MKEMSALCRLLGVLGRVGHAWRIAETQVLGSAIPRRAAYLHEPLCPYVTWSGQPLHKNSKMFLRPDLEANESSRGKICMAEKR